MNFAEGVTTALLLSELESLIYRKCELIEIDPYTNREVEFIRRFKEEYPKEIVQEAEREFQKQKQALIGLITEGIK